MDIRGEEPWESHERIVLEQSVLESSQQPTSQKSIPYRHSESPWDGQKIMWKPASSYPWREERGRF